MFLYVIRRKPSSRPGEGTLPPTPIFFLRHGDDVTFLEAELQTKETYYYSPLHYMRDCRPNRN